MSYDQTVYGTHSLPISDLIAIVKENAGLDVTTDSSPGLTVVRGKRASYCFTIDGPFDIDPVDVPEELSSVAIGLTAMYQILIEGSAEASIPLATRFAKKLAARTGGASVDEQTGAIWAKKGNRAVPRPVATSRIELIEVDWYFRTTTVDLSTAYLTAARKHLPEALPRRFGEFEPLQNSLDAAGDDGFRRSANDASGLLFWKSVFPVISGSLLIRDWGGASRPQQSFSISLERSTFDQPEWNDALRRLFVDFARAGGAFFARAEVVRNVGWGGRSVWYDGKVERPDRLFDRKTGWLGLPPYPVWLTYFGPEYAALVEPYIGRAELPLADGSLFHAWSDRPLDRDKLAGIINADGNAGPRPWLPDNLLATVLPNVRGEWLRPMGRAGTIPKLLDDEQS
jgi:hypothetical protein